MKLTSLAAVVADILAENTVYSLVVAVAYLHIAILATAASAGRPLIFRLIHRV